MSAPQEDDASQNGDAGVGGFTQEEANKKRQNKEEGVSITFLLIYLKETTNRASS